MKKTLIAVEIHCNCAVKLEGELNAYNINGPCGTLLYSLPMVAPLTQKAIWPEEKFADGKLISGLLVKKGLSLKNRYIIIEATGFVMHPPVSMDYTILKTE